VEEFLSERREEEVVEVFMKCDWEGNGGCAGQTERPLLMVLNFK
jgi:hypothetical protein